VTITYMRLRRLDVD